MVQSDILRTGTIDIFLSYHLFGDYQHVFLGFNLFLPFLLRIQVEIIDRKQKPYASQLKVNIFRVIGSRTRKQEYLDVGILPELIGKLETTAADL